MTDLKDSQFLLDGSIKSKLKQHFAYHQMPHTQDFQQQRQTVLNEFFRNVKTFRINSWAARGFDPLFILERYKLTYGLLPQQLEALLTIFSNMLFTQEVLSVESKAFVLKTLNFLLHMKISITNYTIDNRLLLNEYKRLVSENVMAPVKHLQSYIEELNQFTRMACRYGQDIIPSVLQFTIQEKQIKFLALFIRCMKDQRNARVVLEEILCESGSWDRDCHWFYILCKLLENFPGLDISRYLHTIFQTVIKDFCAVSDPVSDAEVSRIIFPDESTGVKSIMRYYSEILVNLLVPRSNPMCGTMWRYVERLLTIIIGPIDLKNQPNYLGYYMKFVRQFVKGFLKRVRKQRKGNKGILENEDSVEQSTPQTWFSDQLPKQLHENGNGTSSSGHQLDDYCISEFKRLMSSLFPTIVMTEDSSNCDVARICLELSMFDGHFLHMTLQSVTEILFSEEEMTLSNAKLILLFLYEHIVLYAPDKIQTLVRCCSRMIELVEKLGLVDHLDMVQLVIRMFMYLPQEMPSVTNLKTDVMNLIFDNLDKFSNVLHLTDNSQAELYLDLKNIFFPLLLTFNQDEISRYADRFAYRASTAIPEHTEVYEMLIVGFSFIEPNLPSLILPHVTSQLLKTGHSDKYYDVLPQTDCLLTTDNQQNIRWYSMLIECAYQYRPECIVRDFSILEKLFVLMMKEEKAVLIQCGWDILHNLMITLATRHISPSNFSNSANNNYTTMKVTWRERTQQQHQLLMYILKKYVYDTMDFVLKRYQNVKPTMSQDEVIDAILVPKAVGISVLEEKKLLIKVISIQQAVVSALLPITPNTQQPGDDPILKLLEPHMLSDLRNLRTDVASYLRRVLEIINELHLVSEQALAKIYSYLYNQIHGDCYISDTLQPTQEKITNMVATSVIKSTKLMNCSFLIVNDMLLSYHCKIELLNGLVPTAQLVSPQHLQDLVLMSHHPDFTLSGKSFFNCSEELLHEYHFKVLQVWWEKLDVTNPKSYFRKLESTNEAENTRERYSNAISSIVQSLKKVATYLAMECCVQDCRIRMLLFKFASIYDNLKKKKDRAFLIDTLFALYSFQFDSTLILTSRTLSLTERETNQGRLAHITNNQCYEKLMSSNLDISDELRLSIKSQNEQILKCIESIVQSCIDSLNNRKHTKQLALYALYILIYFPFIQFKKQITKNIFLCFQKISNCEHHELSQMGRVGIFHFLNRLFKSHTVKINLANTPVKMPFNKFVMYRAFNCPEDKSALAKINKYDNVFHWTKQLEILEQHPIADDTEDLHERVVFEFLTSSERILRFFNGCHSDKELVENTPDDNDPIKTESKAILSECLKLINYLLDRHPKKNNIFVGLVENFSLYECSFYLRLIKRMIKLGGHQTISELQKVARKLESREQTYAHKLYAYLSISLLKQPTSEQFVESYLQQLSICPNDVFTSHLAGMSFVFRENHFTIRNSYARIIEKLKKSRGSSRLRYIEVWKVYILSQGRWARDQALEGIGWILAGVNEASEELADGLVALIVETFILPLNLSIFPLWVQQPIYELTRQKRLFKLNEKVGFEIHQRLNFIFETVTSKIQDEKDLESTNLKMYTKLALRILESLTVYQFNDYFYTMLKGLIIYLVEKQQTSEEFNENDILRRLGESEYPQSVYRHLKESLESIHSTSQVVIKKKLKLLETLMFCHGYTVDKLETPQVFQAENSVTLSHIITVGNICRMMTPKELSEAVDSTLCSEQWTRYPLLMSYLIASGNVNYDWRQKVLRVIVQWRLKKLMKEFIAFWWKGKGEGLKGEEALVTIVKSIQNHYTYFA